MSLKVPVQRTWNGAQNAKRMIFTPTPLQGAMLVDLEVSEDPRGGFARTYCAREFEKHGLMTAVAQCNTSFNRLKGTLRGMHFLKPPGMEPKLVRCVKGSIQDVIIDLRPESDTYLRHFSVVLSESNRKSLYIPGMFAHGFLTLEDDTHVIYNMGDFYAPGLEGGIRYDDPAFGIEWLAPVASISEKDLAWPLLRP